MVHTEYTNVVPCGTPRPIVPAPVAAPDQCICYYLATRSACTRGVSSSVTRAANYCSPSPHVEAVG